MASQDIIDDSSKKYELREIDIAPDGDLILYILDSERHPNFEVILKVYSGAVAAASPVFAPMLDKQSRMRKSVEEAGAESPGGTKRDLLTLYGDDPTAMILLMQAIHYKHDKVPTKLTFQELLQLAIVCQKYDCTAPVAFRVDGWFRPHEKEIHKWRLNFANWDYDVVPHPSWLFIASAFGRRDLFHRAFKLIIDHLATGDRDLLGGSCFRYISNELIETMFEFRLRNINYWLDVLRDIHSTFSIETPSVDQLGQFFEKYNLKKPEGLWRDKRVPVTTDLLRESYVGKWIEEQKRPLPCWDYITKTYRTGIAHYELEPFVTGEFSASEYNESPFSICDNTAGSFIFSHPLNACACPLTSDPSHWACKPCPFEAVDNLWEEVAKQYDSRLGPVIDVGFNSYCRFYKVGEVPHRSVEDY